VIAFLFDPHPFLEIESECFKFIWDVKPDKVKRNTMIGNFEMGV
jgi:hypothetical protein